jgi:hypothetical protein
LYSKGCPFQSNNDVVPAAEAHRLEERVHEFELMLGRKTIEVGALKEALKPIQPKIIEGPKCSSKLIDAALVAQGAADVRRRRRGLEDGDPAEDEEGG